MNIFATFVLKEMLYHKILLLLYYKIRIKMNLSISLSSEEFIPYWKNVLFTPAQEL